MPRNHSAYLSVTTQSNLFICRFSKFGQGQWNSFDISYSLRDTTLKDNNAGGEGHADADHNREKSGINDVGAEGALVVAGGLGGEESSGQAAVTENAPGGATYAAGAIDQQSKHVAASPGEYSC